MPMFSESSSATACRSARLPGAWIGAIDRQSRVVSSRPFSSATQADHARSLPKRGIVPRRYHASEKLDLAFWDPHRVAAHVMATLSPEDKRAEAVNFIIGNEITGSFLARYTYDIEGIFPDANGEIVREIAGTISCIDTFWIQWREPPRKDRYDLRELARDIRASKAEAGHINFSATETRPVPLSSFWQWDPEDAEPELAASSSVSVDDAAINSDVASNSDASDGRPFPGARRVWARISHMICLHGPTFEDWGVNFGSLSELIRGRRDGTRENDNSQARQYSPTRARVPSSSRADTGMDYNGSLSCLRR